MLSMKPPREIEAKYAVADAALFVQLMSLPAIGPFALRASSLGRNGKVPSEIGGS